MKTMHSMFGPVREEFVGWFMKNSGVFHRDGQWYIDSNQKTQNKKRAKQDTKEHKQGDTISIEVLKSSKFQDDMQDARKCIVSTMGTTGNYKIENFNIFELMKDKKTVVEYEYKGEKYEKEIKFSKVKEVVKHGPNY